jgi:hypothetical protein
LSQLSMERRRGMPSLVNHLNPILCICEGAPLGPCSARHEIIATPNLRAMAQFRVSVRVSAEFRLDTRRFQAFGCG